MAIPSSSGGTGPTGGRMAIAAARVATIACLFLIALPRLGFTATFFLDAVQIPSLSEPKSVAIGDVNNDTHPDIVLLSAEADSVQAFLGAGDGTFPTRVNSPIAFPTGTYSHNVILGHFNSDQYLDVVWASGARLVFQAGDGAGGFGPRQAYTSPGSYPAYVSVGDFNEDTISDIVLSFEDDPGSVAVHLGIGDGTFGPGTTFPTSPTPGGIAVADFDNDTHLDLAAACPNSSGNLSLVSVLMGNGDGSFNAKTDFTVNLGPFAVAAADFNGDTKLDLATTGWDGKLAIILGDGTGSFGAKTEYTIGKRGRAIAIGDVDGDGELDIVVPDTGQYEDGTQIAILKGIGDGTFEPPSFEPAGFSPFDIAMADLNHDGKVDVVTPNLHDSLFEPGFEVSILLNCAPCAPTAVSVVLDRIAASNGIVRVRWLLPSGPVVIGTVQRRVEGGDWVDLDQTMPISGPAFEYEDHAVTPGYRYAYRLSLQDETDAWYTNEAWILVPTADPAPARLALRSPYPNPSRGGVSFRFGQPGNGVVKLSVFDVQGREIARVLSGTMESGWSEASWDGVVQSRSRAPGGVYFAVLEGNGEVVRRKFVLAR